MTCDTVASALVFKAFFLFLFGMKLLICVLYEVPQEGKDHQQPQTASSLKLLCAGEWKTKIFAWIFEGWNNPRTCWCLLTVCGYFTRHKHLKSQVKAAMDASGSVLGSSDLVTDHLLNGHDFPEVCAIKKSMRTVPQTKILPQLDFLNLTDCYRLSLVRQ